MLPPVLQSLTHHCLEAAQLWRLVLQTIIARREVEAGIRRVADAGDQRSCRNQANRHL